MPSVPFTSDHEKRLDAVHRAVCEKPHDGEDSFIVRASRMLDVMEQDAGGSPLYRRLCEIQRAIDTGSVAAKWILGTVITVASIGTAILTIASWGVPK